MCCKLRLPILLQLKVFRRTKILIGKSKASFEGLHMSKNNTAPLFWFNRAVSLWKVSRKVMERSNVGLNSVDSFVFLVYFKLNVSTFRTR